MRLLSLIQIVLLFTSCLGGEESSSSSKRSSDKAYVPTGPITYEADIYAEQGESFQAEGRDLFQQNVTSGYTFTLSGPATSFLSINANTGELTAEAQSNGLYENNTITATETSSGTEFEETFSIAVNGDPLREHAWHLQNTGQKSFARTAGTASYDLNVYDVYKSGITGKNVRVAISDSGVDLIHDDLSQNSLAGEHRDYSLSSPYIGDPTPTSAHGTAVTGIIAARGWNNIGSMGVAPLAKFAGFQFLDSPQNTSVLIHQASGNFRVFNYSYGDAIYQDTLSDPDYIDHLRYSSIQDNKVYIKASGNEFAIGQGSVCAPHNANMPFENESPYVILVGAIDAKGNKAIYSNAGSNLWVVAPGGDYGIDEPAIVTTDLPTCFKGYSKAVSSPLNSFEYNHSLNPKCLYTSTMNGTSSSAPMVSGVVALLLEANPSLKMRDIKHIFASTSRVIDPAHTNYFGKDHPSASLVGCSDRNLSGYTYEQGWVQNDAGYRFNNYYGFGLVDAEAAVAMAQTYTFPLGTLVEQNPDFNISKYSSGTLNNSIPDNNASGTTDSINVSSSDALTVESVQIKVRVSHSEVGQVGVELTSPAGTKSILLNINNSLLLYDSNDDGTLDGDQNLNVVLTSNAFYGEDSEGNWTIRIIDGDNGNTGSLTDWKINILGHN